MRLIEHLIKVPANMAEQVEAKLRAAKQSGYVRNKVFTTNDLPKGMVYVEILRPATDEETTMTPEMYAKAEAGINFIFGAGSYAASRMND